MEERTQVANAHTQVRGRDTDLRRMSGNELVRHMQQLGAW
jgi:hypothetical protein